MTDTIRLTKNEKKTLKILLDNSRTSDSEIANKLKISSQAVGKIRRKLEKDLIKNYSLQVDYAKFGIHTFAIAIAKLTREGLDKGELEIEQLLLNNDRIISVYRLPRGSSTHILFFGFQDINDFDDYFHSSSARNKLQRFIEIQDLFTFSHNSLIKNNPAQLIRSVIDNLDTPKTKLAFKELENFKRKLV